MKFLKGQKIVCVSTQFEWDSAISDFNVNLMIALNTHLLPKKGVVYEVESPCELFHLGKSYIKIKGFPNNIFDENGFKELDEVEAITLKEKAIKKTKILQKL